MSKVTELKDKFVEIYTENIKRPGSEKLLNYLLSENSDFFVAPASQDTTEHTRVACANTAYTFMSA